MQNTVINMDISKVIKKVKIDLSYCQAISFLFLKKKYELIFAFNNNNVTHLNSYYKQIHLNSYYKQTHLNSYYKQIHLNSYYKQTHLNSYYKQTHLNSYYKQTHLNSYYKQTHLNSYYKQTHLKCKPRISFHLISKFAFMLFHLISYKLQCVD